MTRAILDAAYNVAHDYPGGAESLAPRLGKLGTSLCHELTATGTAKLGLIDAVKITDFASDLRILQAWATHAGQQLVPLPITEGGDECLTKVSAMARAFGELLTEVTADLGDGKISNNELKRVEREAGELISSVSEVLRALRARNQADKPGGAK